MQLTTAIRERRSIRRFTPEPICQEFLETIFDLTIQAPSAKNDQPWRFVVLTGGSKAGLMERIEARADELTANQIPTGSLKGSIKAMHEAPVLILVYNGLAREGLAEYAGYAKLLVDTQSLGAAIQTLILAAQSKGLGTLWICDVLYATEAINSFVGKEEELVAAVALGYPAASPSPRPRKDWREFTKFLD